MPTKRRPPDKSWNAAVKVRDYDLSPLQVILGISDADWPAVRDELNVVARQFAALRHNVDRAPLPSARREALVRLGKALSAAAGALEGLDEKSREDLTWALAEVSQAGSFRASGMLDDAAGLCRSIAVATAVARNALQSTAGAPRKLAVRVKLPELVEIYESRTGENVAWGDKYSHPRGRQFLLKFFEQIDPSDVSEGEIETAFREHRKNARKPSSRLGKNGGRLLTSN